MNKKIEKLVEGINEVYPKTDRLNTYFARSEAQKILIELEKLVGNQK